ncbi:phospholipase D-like domain-containing protein [Pacificimonas sp. ICDLI1SI03]
MHADQENSAHERQDDALRLLHDGPAAYDALIELIEGARESLKLLFYTFASDKCGKRVLEALVAAQRRGVAVELAVDDFGSLETDDDFFAPLDDAGARFNEFQSHLLRAYLLRNHQKVAIADGARGIVGSFNVADPHLLGEESGWRDIGVYIEGPAVGRLAVYYDRLMKWMCSEKPRTRELREILEDCNETSGKVRWILGGPARGDNHYVQAIEGAFRESNAVDMIMAYFSPPGHVLKAVRALAARGRLRLIAAGKTDVGISRLAGWHTFGRLLKSGAEVWEYQPCKLHTKLIVTDDAVFIGSGNFDVRSLYVNLEIMLRVENADFRKQVCDMFDEELKESTRVDMQLYKSRDSLLRRAIWGVSYWVMVWLDRRLSRFFAQ